MGDLFERIMVLVFVLQALYSLYRRLFGGGEMEETPDDYQPLEALAPDAYALIVNESIAQLQRAIQDAGDLDRRIKAIVALPRAEGRAYTVLHSQISGPISAKIGILREQLSHAENVLENEGEVATAAYLNQSQLIADAFRELAQLWSEIEVIEEFLKQRKRPESGRLLLITEALATDLMTPFAKVAAHRGLKTDKTQIIAVLSDRETGTLPSHFLPGYQTVRVSPTAISEPNAWLNVVHSTAEGMLRAYPSVLAEFTSVLGETDTPWLPRRQGRRVVLDVRAMFGAWRETIIADVIATLWLGPAYVQGLASLLERPDNPETVMDAETAPDGRQFADHPPAHLRVLLACEVLQSTGFTHESSEVRRQWFEDHGESDGMWTETMWGQYLQVPWNQLFMIGSELIRHIIHSPLHAIGRNSLIEIEGMAMTPERWHEVELLLSDWIGNKENGGRPSVCLSALLIGQGEYPSHIGRLLKQMIQAVLAKKSQRKRNRPTAHKALSLDRPVTLRECTEAFILRTVLHRRPVRQHTPQRERLS
jgi:hypothetical protein